MEKLLEDEKLPDILQEDAWLFSLLAGAVERVGILMHFCWV
jgi:hypothetical protein